MMARSVLLTILRESMEEVFQAQSVIDKAALLAEHPLLSERVNVTVNIFIDKELKASYRLDTQDSLLQNIIHSAKKAAFEHKYEDVLTVSEYLYSELELILHTAQGDMKERDPAIISHPLT